MSLRTIARLSFMIMMAVTPMMNGAWAQENTTKPEQIVERSQQTLDHFTADPNMTWFRENLKSAKALLIVPKQIKAGFIFGGSGGSGVLVAHDPKAGWSQPAFYGMGSGSVGLQIGAQVAEVTLLIMTQKGLDSLLSTKVQLGGDISVAAGPVGVGAQVATADVLAFARTKGVFGGISLEGSVISPKRKTNRAYYGREVRPVDILIRRDINNSHAAKLVAALTTLTKAKK